MPRPFPIGTLFLLVVAQVTPAQNGYSIWRNQAGSQPSARQGHAMVYDAARARTVLFGGFRPGTGVLNDTWEWDGTAWVARSPTSSPPGRYLHAMAYDSTLGRTLLFGGEASGVLNDTWEWDGTNWTQHLPNARPPNRNHHALAYDSLRGRVVLFGGANPTFGALADTWEWDGTTWTQRFVGGFPSARFAHALAYDSRRGKTVLFGGLTNAGRSGDTWEWDGTTWAQGPSGPSARTDHALAFHDVLGRTVLFGGQSAVGLVADTWEWNGTTWARRLDNCPCPCLPGPMARYQHAIAYHAARARTVLFGGYGNSLLGDTWEYESADIPPPCFTLGLGHCTSASLAIVCTTAPRIGTSFCTSFSNPGPAAGFNMIYINIPPGSAMPFNSPAVCSPGYLYSFPPIIFTPVLGDPAVFCLSVPNDPVLIGQRFGFQGGSFQINSCFRLTDGLAVTVQP